MEWTVNSNLWMEDLFFDVYSAQLFLPKCIKDASEAFEFQLLVLELLLEKSAIPGHVFVTRAHRRSVGPTKKRNVPMQFAQPLLYSHQLLTKVLQLSIKGATVVWKRPDVSSDFWCRKSWQSLAALFVKFLVGNWEKNNCLNIEK